MVKLNLHADGRKDHMAVLRKELIKKIHSIEKSEDLSKEIKAKEIAKLKKEFRKAKIKSIFNLY